MNFVYLVCGMCWTQAGPASVNLYTWMCVASNVRFLPACTFNAVMLALLLLLLQVPMRQVTLEAMESLLLRYKGRYTTVVGFKPTGWSHAGGAGRGAVGHGGGAAAAAGPSRSSLSIKPNRRRSQRGTVVMYQVRC
jgi:hypothetical protein